MMLSPTPIVRLHIFVFVSFYSFSFSNRYSKSNNHKQYFGLTVVKFKQTKELFNMADARTSRGISPSFYFDLVQLFFIIKFLIVAMFENKIRSLQFSQFSSSFLVSFTPWQTYNEIESIYPFQYWFYHSYAKKNT